MQKPALLDLKYPIYTLCGISVTCFILSFIFISSDLNSTSKLPALRIGTPVGGAFTMIGMIAATAAQGFRSVRRYLEQSPLSATSENPDADEAKLAKS
jgi:hypothetical protein